MKINSRAKGKVGELEARDLLRRFGFTAKRGQQNAGGVDSPDIIHNIPGVHFEVKRVERLNIDTAMAQAVRDAGENTPCVLHRRNKGKWMATIPADVLLVLLGGVDLSDL